jgi:hypothetical protein
MITIQKLAITLLGTLSLLSLAVYSQRVESPLRVQFNAELIRSIFHKKDHEILDVFQDLELGQFELKNGHSIQDLKVSFSPKDNSLHDYDMHISLDDKTFIGVESQDLKFEGRGFIVHGSGDQA